MKTMDRRRVLGDEACWTIIQTCLDDHLDRQKLSRLKQAEKGVYLCSVIKAILQRHKIDITSSTEEGLKQRLYHELFGFGQIEPLLADPSVSDILINGCKPIYVDRQGVLSKTACRYETADQVMHLLMKLLARSGKRIDATRPYVDGSLPDGTRFNAVISPTALDGPYISIRKFPDQAWSFARYLEDGFLNLPLSKLLTSLLLAKMNMLIFGGTGTGKTSLLNAMLQQLPSQERIVIVEDTAELVVTHEHTLRLETWDNVETGKSITQRDLLKNALRMRPDRIIVGEIRGDEVIEMFQAMNTGHDGSISTVHASDVSELPNRLINLVAVSGVEVSSSFVLQQMATCIHFVIQLERGVDGRRRISNVSEVVGRDGDNLCLEAIYQCHYDVNKKSFAEALNIDRLSKVCVERLHQYDVYRHLFEG
jgi:pilus assembly protein CpaF